MSSYRVIVVLAGARLVAEVLAPSSSDALRMVLGAFDAIPERLSVEVVR